MQLRKCECEDSKGTACHKTMTAEEESQDGMCSACAEHVWEEMQNGTLWVHNVKAGE